MITKIPATAYYPALYLLALLMMMSIPSLRAPDVAQMLGYAATPFIFGALLGRFYSRTAGVIATVVVVFLIYMGT